MLNFESTVEAVFVGKNYFVPIAVQMERYSVPQSSSDNFCYFEMRDFRIVQTVILNLFTV